MAEPTCPKNSLYGWRRINHMFVWKCSPYLTLFKVVPCKILKTHKLSRIMKFWLPRIVDRLWLLLLMNMLWLLLFWPQYHHIKLCSNSIWKIRMCNLRLGLGGPPETKTEDKSSDWAAHTTLLDSGSIWNDFFVRMRICRLFFLRLI